MSTEQEVARWLAEEAMAGPRRATVLERLDARFGDAVLAAGVVAVLFAFALLWTGDLEAARFWGPYSALSVLPILEMTCVSHRGTTPGKAVKRMRIASLTSATGAPTRAQVAVRSVALLWGLLGAVLLWWPLVLLYPLSAFTNPDRRWLHDFVAGTVVIRDVR